MAGDVNIFFGYFDEEGKDQRWRRSVSTGRVRRVLIDHIVMALSIKRGVIKKAMKSVTETERGSHHHPRLNSSIGRQLMVRVFLPTS